MKKIIALLAGLNLISFAVCSNSRFDDVEVTATQVVGNVFVLTGTGGNIGILTGSDGILMVDDQFEPLAHKIEKAIKVASPNSPNKVTYVVNTHYHGDHTGSNVYFSKSASILAHENVRKRMSVKQKGPGLPVITYSDGVKLYVNDDRVHVKHLSSGHTDGDSVVYFEKHNVWHLGDMLFESRFPYIDLKSGGSVQGYIQNLETLLAQIDDTAKVIPGHGNLTDRVGVKNLKDMIVATFAEVSEMKSRGMTLAQVIEQGLDQKWQAWSWSFINEERWITTLYE
ncbi:MBL fold metallo-hydrolase [Psychrosphaera sp. B3R10]|uniref:MBL fold metallo-hydrolase n=1 Tax=unclassified Psychrosphaera TaxID=2641570 RepID=UPI001C08CDCA|nr:MULTISPECIES: MBL fold metallo-hydrolase [unclassified Psychrosphaera]MBU2882531.1 MBL fold metallo-hydrolase [Psychrosphaera sp. I2R16]MBU2989451.1 MBL fold metallo-hydrolase [Psychrosphaera sp. B3R10]MDO6718285.1 MBL fold metallo-hydrolase [Psychrosphaera sp. 1_MG-2023]